MIDDTNATQVIAQLLYLNYLDSRRPVRVFVDSPGGDMAGGMAILDTMGHIGPAVHTCCTGIASGIALAIVAHGDKGHRSASVGAKFMFTPIWAPETEDDVERELEKAQQVFINLVIEDTKRTAVEVKTDMENPRFLNAAEARTYGIIDYIEHSSK